MFFEASFCAIAEAKIFGSSTWARTRDLRINSPALYRLSYRGTSLTLYTQKSPKNRWNGFLWSISLALGAARAR